MIITVKINTDSAIGKQLENELRRYPESGIYFVREVHEETMNREIEQLNKLVLDDK